MLLKVRRTGCAMNPAGKKIRPALAFWRCLGPGGGGEGEGEVPAAHSSKTIHGIEMKFGGEIENHKLIKLV